MSPETVNGRSSNLAWLQVAGALIIFGAITALGYLGFRTFATGSLGVLNLYVLAVAAGIASFFSPCGFPLLPGYLSFYYLAGREDNGLSAGTGRAFKLGLAAALGVITFTLALGLLIAILGASIGQSLSISGAEPNQFVRLFRGLVGLTLLVLGIGQLAGWNLKPTFVDAFAYRTRPQREGGRSPAANLYLYGLGYNAAGMGCSGPILAGLMLTALASGGFGAALSAFTLFALTMAALMLILSGLVAASRYTLITHLKTSTPRIKTAASSILILVGIFNLYFALNLGAFLRFLFP